MIVTILLNNGANVQTNNNQALLVAVYQNYPEIVTVLLKSGADANDRGGLIFKAAVSYGNPVIVRVMLDHGARVTREIALTAIRPEIRRMLG